MRQLVAWVRVVLAFVASWLWSVRLSLANPEALVRSPNIERKAAEGGLVPRRCGLCKHFSRVEFEGLLKTNPAFAEMTQLLKPHQTGKPRTAEELARFRGSDAARKLRPALVNDWPDYGVCQKNAVAIWGFDEQPKLDADSPPCGDWA